MRWKSSEDEDDSKITALNGCIRVKSIQESDHHRKSEPRVDYKPVLTTPTATHVLRHTNSNSIRNNTFKTVIKRNTPRLLEPCVSNRAVGKSSYGKNAGYNEFGLNIEYQINRKN